MIAALHLDISDPQASLPFYVERLGMRYLGKSHAEEENAHEYALALPSGRGHSTELRLRHRLDVALASARYRPRDDDVYWKVGITLADVDLARARLAESGIAVTEAEQFHDIGYLCHLDDPDGYAIELLQHGFEGSPRPARNPDDPRPLGGEATLGQISLRVRDIDASLAFYRDALGMRLLSRQRVPSRGFTLYFLAFTDESPPDPDIDAVWNREWLWERPYTTLELRHDANAPVLRPHPHDSELGFRGMVMARSVGETTDPDGVRLRRASGGEAAPTA